MHYILVILSVFILQACGDSNSSEIAKKMNDDPNSYNSLVADGLCPIDCSNAVLSPASTKIKVVGSPNVDYQCLNEEEPTPVTVRFFVHKDSSEESTNVSFSDGEIEQLNLENQPLLRVAFAPLLNGVRDASRTNLDIVDVCDGCGGSSTDVGIGGSEWYPFCNCYG